MQKQARRIVISWFVLFASLLLVPTASAQNTDTPPAGQAGTRVTPVQRSVTSQEVSPAPQSPAATTTPLAQTSTVPANSSDLIIGSGDLLEVSVYGAPDFIKQVRVSDSGQISLPLIGSVQVAGHTIHDAELIVQKRLADGGFFTDPQVSIFAREYATQGISVLGEVQKPGIYPLPGQRSLFDAISAAGGVTPRAGNTVTITHRARPQEPQTVQLPSGKTLPSESNVDVFPGDTIVVSKAGIVYVVGDVHLPGGFVLENSDLTVLQAVAMAQGTNTTAKLDNTVLIRKTPEGRQEIPILLSKVMTAKAPDPKLQADDIVFVPRSTAKAGYRRGLEAILQTVTGVVIYRR